MVRRSEHFQLVQVGGGIALAFALKTLLDMSFEAGLRGLLEHSLGQTGADVVGGLILVGIPLALAVAIVWFLSRFIRRDYEASLAELHHPKLACSFDASDQGCVRQGQVVTFYERTMDGVMMREDEADCFRLKIEAPHLASIVNASGHLISIRRNNDLLFEGDLPLSFVGEDGAAARLIAPGLPQYLNIFAITEHDRIILMAKGFLGPGSEPYGDLLIPSGAYRFGVVISSPTAHCSVALVLEWSGRKADAVLRASRSAPPAA